MKNNLTKDDITQWIVDVIVFNLTPVAIVFFTTLQTGDLHTAFGAAYAALIAALINLMQKYKSGEQQKGVLPLKEVPPVVPVQPVETPEVTNV